MGYSKEKAVKIEDYKSKYMPVGINENVHLASALVKESPNGKPILEIILANEEEQTVIQTEWEPQMASWMKGPEQLEEQMNKQYKRMLQLLLCFYKDEEIDFNGEKFIDFANYVVDKLNNADKSILLRVKVVYNKNGYTTLPNSVSRTFVEPMSVPKEESKIEIDPKYDMITKPIVADTEVTVTTPFTNAVSSTEPVTFSTSTTTDATADSDLPF